MTIFMSHAESMQTRELVFSPHGWACPVSTLVGRLLALPSVTGEHIAPVSASSMAVTGPR